VLTAAEETPGKLREEVILAVRKLDKAAAKRVIPGGVNSTVRAFKAVGGTPIFVREAKGAYLTDVDGNRYLDLTSAFGVAASGHTNPRVVDAITSQAQRLVHGMGDVHPTEVRARLLQRLAELAPGALQKTYLATGGAEAIERAAGAPFVALATIDEIYPERPDR